MKTYYNDWCIYPVSLSRDTCRSSLTEVRNSLIDGPGFDSPRTAMAMRRTMINGDWNSAGSKMPESEDKLLKTTLRSTCTM